VLVRFPVHLGDSQIVIGVGQVLRSAGSRVPGAYASLVIALIPPDRSAARRRPARIHYPNVLSPFCEPLKTLHEVP
jgi:hypothetical protein